MGSKLSLYLAKFKGLGTVLYRRHRTASSCLVPGCTTAHQTSDPGLKYPRLESSPSQEDLSLSNVLDMANTNGCAVLYCAKTT